MLVRICYGRQHRLPNVEDFVGFRDYLFRVGVREVPPLILAAMR